MFHLDESTSVDSDLEVVVKSFITKSVVVSESSDCAFLEGDGESLSSGWVSVVNELAAGRRNGAVVLAIVVAFVAVLFGLEIKSYVQIKLALQILPK